MMLDAKVAKNSLEGNLIIDEKSLYKCTFQDCCKKFKTKFALTRHNLVHTSERHFKCNECGRSFSISQYLREHMNIHTRENPYTCGIGGCMERFRQAGKLSMHRRTHPEYTVKKYRYSLNTKKKKINQENAVKEILPERNTAQFTENLLSKQDQEQHPTSQPINDESDYVKKKPVINKLLPPIALLIPMNFYFDIQAPKYKGWGNLSKVNVPPNSFPMMDCLPWLSLPSCPLFHPVLPIPNEKNYF